MHPISLRITLNDLVTTKDGALILGCALSLGNYPLCVENNISLQPHMSANDKYVSINTKLSMATVEMFIECLRLSREANR